jgi:hypothetical protein
MRAAIPESVGRRVERPRRVVARLRDAAREYDASVARMAIRAGRLRTRGWRLGEMAYLGLLDPDGGRDVERWAVRPTEFTALQERLNPPNAVASVEDKRLFAVMCARRGLPTPPIVADLRRSSDRHWTVRDWADTLSRDAPAEFFVKPSEGTRGIGVRAMTRTPEGASDFHGPRRTWGDLARSLADEPWPEMIVQPWLHSHPDIVALSGVDVLQTLRIVTLRLDGGPARVVWAGLRIATGSVPMDTYRGGATGNIHAQVRSDGTLHRAVGVAPSGFGLVWVDAHPVTGATIAGTRVPEWDACRGLAERAARLFAPLRTVGWDVAPTAQGPVLIEGNAWWSPLQDPAGGSVPVRDALRQAAARLSSSTA